MGFPMCVATRPTATRSGVRATQSPTIDLVIGYNKTNASPILGLFLSRLDQLRKKAPQTH
jgi:hypothetical protein